MASRFLPPSQTLEQLCAARPVHPEYDGESYGKSAFVCTGIAGAGFMMHAFAPDPGAVPGIVASGAALAGTGFLYGLVRVIARPFARKEQDGHVYFVYDGFAAMTTLHDRRKGDRVIPVDTPADLHTALGMPHAVAVFNGVKPIDLRYTDWEGSSSGDYPPAHWYDVEFGIEVCGQRIDCLARTLGPRSHDAFERRGPRYLVTSTHLADRGGTQPGKKLDVYFVGPALCPGKRLVLRDIRI